MSPSLERLVSSRAPKQSHTRASKDQTSAKLAKIRVLMQQTERRFADTSKPPGLSASGCRQDNVQPQRIWNFGLPAIDAHLPAQGLALDGVHEIMGRAPLDATAASGFALSALRQLIASENNEKCHTVLWCQPEKTRQETGLAYCTGLRMFGLDTLRLVFIRGTRQRDVLWALEEGARSGALCAVIGEIDNLSFTESRRLSFAAAAKETPVILLHSGQSASTSAASTRWQVNTIPSAIDTYDPHAPGRMRWHVALGKCRGGKPGDWRMEWDHEAYRLDLVDKFSARVPEPQTREKGIVLPLRRAG